MVNVLSDRICLLSYYRNRVTMNGRYKRILLPLMTVLLVLLWPTTTLEMRDKDGSLLSLESVKSGDTMVYHSIHSVSMTRLEETIRFERSLEFVGVKVRYEDQSGAGLPEFPHDGGNFYTENGWFVLEDYNRVYPSLSFRINEAYDNRLDINGNQILLYNYFDHKKGVLNMKLVRQPVGLFLLKHYITNGGYYE